MITSDEMNILLDKYAEYCSDAGQIDQRLYSQYDVKRGLRDSNGKGVLTGLTEISTVNGTREVDGKIVPIEGELYYRGINIEELVKGFSEDKRFGYEETVYLLLFGSLPDRNELDHWNQ